MILTYNIKRACGCFTSDDHGFAAFAYILQLHSLCSIHVVIAFDLAMFVSFIAPVMCFRGSLGCMDLKAG